MMTNFKSAQNRKWLLWALLALVIGGTLLAALPILTYPMGRDQAMYGNIGRTILNGGIPFVDMWDIKPPPIYYLYAFAIGLFGATTTAVRTLDFMFAPITMLALYWLMQRLSNRRAALLSVVIFGTFYFTESFASLSQSDSLVTMPMTLAAVCAYQAMQHPRASRRALYWSLAVGALCGVILWFKHYYALFVLALVVNQIWTRRALPVREAIAFSIGGLLTGGALLVYFAALGMVQEMIYVAQGTAAYNAQGYDFAAFIGSMGNYVQWRWWHWGVMLVLAALWLPLRWWGGKRQPGWRLVLLWLLGALAFALVQAKGFDTHWIPMLPPLALMAADALDRLLNAISRGARLALVPRLALYGVCVVALWGIIAHSTWARALPYIAGQETRIDYFAKFQANDLKPAESLAVLDYLQPRMAAGERLMVWGFRPEIAYMGGWWPATRYQAHFPLVAAWYPQAWQQDHVDTLWATRPFPPYVLILQADYMPWVTGREEDSHELLQEYIEFNNWIMANYERIDQIGNFLIWQRRTQP